MKIDHDLMVSMMRIGRKFILCYNKKVPKAEMKKILDRTEREIDKMLGR
jgi:hypothetical protein